MSEYVALWKEVRRLQQRLDRLQGVSLPTRNRVTIADPTADDDITQGFGMLSTWLNSAADTYFICVDATEGAAIWKEVEFVP